MWTKAFDISTRMERLFRQAGSTMLWEAETRAYQFLEEIRELIYQDLISLAREDKCYICEMVKRLD